MATSALPVSYRDEDVELTGFVVRHENETAARPGILLVHGGAGLDDHAKGQAARYAALGYVVLACDMYGPGAAGDRERIMATLGELRNDPDKMCRRAQAGLTVLSSRPDVDGRAAAVGFCFGGMVVLTLARAGTDLDAVVSMHGSLSTSRRAQPRAIRAKVLACHGALDPHVPMTDVAAFVDEMNEAGADWQLNAYGGAVHGFTHKDAVEGATPGVAYDARTDARSFAAARALFQEAFQTTPA
ncbi:MAG: dienelactone hydrolase family protein [Acidimicrobiia bacterium]|nr:dienelactone hydrolase family protein [Acidimicrobiia bacterium]